MKNIKLFEEYQDSISKWLGGKLNKLNKEYDERFYFWFEENKESDTLKELYNEYVSETKIPLSFEKWAQKYYNEEIY